MGVERWEKIFDEIVGRRDLGGGLVELSGVDPERLARFLAKAIQILSKRSRIWES